MAKAKRKAPATALARVENPVRRDEAEQPLAIIERVAKDKSVDVEKLGKLIELQKDMMRTQAKIDFDQAFSALALDLPVIKKRGKIAGKNRPTIHYARLGEDIHPIIKPILARHGFAIRHRTEWPTANQVRVIGILSHRSGHSEVSAFEAPADQSDYRTHVQSLGSTVSYGRRYTTIDLLNLTIEGVDDDGARGAAPPAETRTAPPEERSSHGREDEKITIPQRQRLTMIINKSDRSDAEVAEWLERAYGIRDVKPTREIRVRDYDKIVAAIEASGALPQGRA